ncbi:hypothetical protein BJV82DRAFT_74471 [Fennellomyces sp. T-0311]|nr:hypothetical protein BJV82DRAFT_74471 [Fennellomyces sp. T-0311]
MTADSLYSLMVTQKSLQQFHTLTLAFYRHAVSSNDNTPSLVELLNALDTLDAPVKNVPDQQQIIDILVAGCKCLNAEHEACPAFCKFMFKACAKQIRLTSLRSSHFEICITFLLDGLERVQGQAELRVDMLRALSALVFENASNASKYYPRVSNLLLRLADRSTRPLEVRRMAINCIGNSCASAGSRLQPYYQSYYQALLSNVCVVEHGSHGTMMVASASLDFSDSAIRKVASSTLRALQFILAQDKNLITNPLCDIIQIVQKFIFTSVSTQAYNAMNKEEPAQLPRVRRLPQPRRSQQISWRQLEPRAIGLTSSDSELSDTADTTMANPRRQRDDAKIRINALLCLAAIAKTSPRVLYPQWQKFIPDTFSIFLNNNSDQHGHLAPALQSDNQPLSLFTLLLYDPTVTVRTAVCNTLMAMLDGSKQYLSVASERSSKSSFTSLSERLASTLCDFHAGLICALDKEQHPQVLALMMKLTCVLVVNSPYDRLSKGYVGNLYKTVMKRWDNGSAPIRASILAVFSAILENGPVDQVAPLLIDSLLIDLLLESMVTGQDTELVAMAWQTLGILAKSHSTAIIGDKWDTIHKQFGDALNNQEPAIRVAALKFAESYASSMIPADDESMVGFY